MWDRLRKKQRPSSLEMVEVPEGHKVVTVRPAPEAYCSKTESGIWIADFGPAMSQAREALLASTADVLRKEPAATVLWVVQASAMAGWSSEPSRVMGWLCDLRAVTESRTSRTAAAQCGVSKAFWVTGPSSLAEWMYGSATMTRHPITPDDIAVVPDLGANAESLQLLLLGMGCNVHLLGPPGDVVLMEIHRPDGAIEVLMPGPTWRCRPDSALLRLIREETLARQQPGAGTGAADATSAGVAFIAQLMHEVLQSRPPNRLTLPELVTRIAGEAGPSVALLNALDSALLAGQVGARVPDSYGFAPPGRHIVQEGEDLRIPTMMLPNGERALRVICDIPGMQALHVDAQFFELSGVDALTMARDAGIGLALVNETSGAASWVGVTEAQVRQILADKDRQRGG